MHLKRFPRISLHCKLVSVQYWEYAYGLLMCLIWVFFLCSLICKAIDFAMEKWHLNKVTHVVYTWNYFPFVLLKKSVWQSNHLFVSQTDDTFSLLTGNCSFERGFCNWKNWRNKMEDQFDWKIGNMVDEPHFQSSLKQPSGKTKKTLNCKINWKLAKNKSVYICTQGISFSSKGLNLVLSTWAVVYYTAVSSLAHAVCDSTITWILAAICGCL